MLEALGGDTDIAQTLASLKGEGRWRRALCPFHDDHKRSFWIDTERNLFGCHACDAAGDAINLYSRVHGVTNGDAIRELARGLDARVGAKA
jgi:DNA primase